MSKTGDRTFPRRGLMLVLSSPSGAGKTTIARALLERDDNLTLSVSSTTRPKRPGEVDGKDYHFVSDSQFQGMVADGELLEHAQVFGNYYGTPKAPVEETLAGGKDILFDIDWQGTQQLAGNDTTGEDLVSIFVLPPDNHELELRLRRRAQDSEAVVHGRMAKAADEMSHYREYNYIIVNHDIEESVGQAQIILEAERLRINRQAGLHDFVQTLRGDD